MYSVNQFKSIGWKLLKLKAIAKQLTKEPVLEPMPCASATHMAGRGINGLKGLFGGSLGAAASATERGVV